MLNFPTGKTKKKKKIARSDLYNCKKFQDQKHHSVQDIFIYKYILDLHTQCKHCSQ